METTGRRSERIFSAYTTVEEIHDWYHFEYTDQRGIAERQPGGQKAVWRVIPLWSWVY